MQSEIQLITAAIFEKAWEGQSDVFTLSQTLTTSAIRYSVQSEPVLPPLPEHALTLSELVDRPLPYIGYESERVVHRGTYKTDKENKAAADEGTSKANEQEQEDEDNLDLGDILEMAPQSYELPQPEFEVAVDAGVEEKTNEANSQTDEGRASNGEREREGVDSNAGGGANSSSDRRKEKEKQHKKKKAKKNGSKPPLGTGKKCNKNYDVMVTIGRNQSGELELWFFIQCATSNKVKMSGKRCVQYLEECPDYPGYYQVSAEVDKVSEDIVEEAEHTWERVQFNERTHRQRKIVTTTKPFPADDLKKLALVLEERKKEKAEQHRRRTQWDNSSDEDDEEEEEEDEDEEEEDDEDEEEEDEDEDDNINNTRERRPRRRK